MKSGILRIAKKELIRYFTDKRMVITVILMPGLLIYLLYSVMGGAMSGLSESESPSEVLALHTPPALESYFSALSDTLTVTEISENQLETAKESLANAEADLLLVFPADFESAVTAYDATSGQPAPDISIFYNGGETQSQMAYEQVTALLNTYESTMSNKFDINRENPDFDLATGENFATKLIFSMLPFLLLILLFSSCMAVATESIAGEKERGTIATLLVTPLRRIDLAVGKILALSIITLCSGLSSFLGIMLSLPKLMFFGGDLLQFSSYSTTDYLLLLLIIFATLLLMVGMVSILSAFAKSVKEAGTLVTPLMVLIMFAGISGIFGAGAQTETLYYLVPFYNSVQAMLGILLRDFSPVNVLVCCLSNLVYGGIAAFVLTKMFCSEKIMFSK